MALSSDKDAGANLGQSAGARAIEARAAIATAQLRSTVTSISSSVGWTSSHGERIVETIDGLIDDVVPELEAAEAITAAGRSGRAADGGSTSRSSLWVETQSTVGASS
ncbi:MULTISPECIES: hypothetical protein [Tsukamurella]|uniref:Uncharacterized protein n=2 Tax=Tsukamurella TaxID=2060 RepID=A0A5C5RUS5_9ACTN|nr:MULTISPECIES: hypothetical protein [Tsukamurella]NMD58445.1 hypothetical protein [Tsukamurella columbiensis]TWS26779.1 hypothetical protein FK530_21685 [Tsukamurella conjunctivitidis]